MQPAERILHAQWINLGGYIVPNAYLLATNCNWFTPLIRERPTSTCDSQLPLTTMIASYNVSVHCALHGI